MMQMRRNFFRNILTFIRNLFRHGNIDDIDTSFDLLTEKGEMAIIRLPPIVPNLPEEIVTTDKENQEYSSKKEEPEKITEFQIVSEAEEVDSNIYAANDLEFDFDDETKRKIYEILKEIKDFEQKVNKLRNLKFVKRDKKS